MPLAGLTALFPLPLGMGSYIAPHQDNFWLWITKMSNFVIIVRVSPTKSSEAETLPLIGPVPS
jgi:hypothetical protein